MDSLQNTTSRISNRVSKLFKNQQITFFIIMFLILLITCYPLLSSTLKYTVSMILSNPAVMVVCIIIILAIGYFDIGIASLTLVLFFILLFGNANTETNLVNLGALEGFKTDTTTSDSDDTDLPDETETIDRHISKITKKTISNSQNNLKKKAENDKKLDERVNNIKDVVLGTINKIRNSNNDDYKRALLENKQAMLNEEHENNSSRGTSRNIKGKDGEDSKEDFNDTNTKNGKNSKARKDGKNNKAGKERFQTVEVRALDPSNEDDTNLLITKEILQDMLNRIEYNYESNKYLRKYIKHRVEEIIDINKLTDDE